MAASRAEQGQAARFNDVGRGLASRRTSARRARAKAIRWRSRFNQPDRRTGVPKMTIVVRELGKTKPDYSLAFDLPEIPRVGDYISIHRPDKPEPFGEDLIVRHVWWRLEHPETRGVATSGSERTGRIKELFVECDQAIGPYSSADWRDSLDAARKRGAAVDQFGVSRSGARESAPSKS